MVLCPKEKEYLVQEPRGESGSGPATTILSEWSLGEFAATTILCSVGFEIPESWRGSNSTRDSEYLIKFHTMSAYQSLWDPCAKGQVGKEQSHQLGGGRSPWSSRKGSTTVCYKLRVGKNLFGARWPTGAWLDIPLPILMVFGQIPGHDKGMLTGALSLQGWESWLPHQVGYQDQKRYYSRIRGILNGSQRKEKRGTNYS